MRILTLIVLLLGLTACAASTPSIENLRIDPPPASLVIPCNRAVRLPDRELTQAEVERFWIRDRQRLAECRSRHGGLVEWSRDVTSSVEGAK